MIWWKTPLAIIYYLITKVMFKQQGSLKVVIALVVGTVIVGGGYLVWRSQQESTADLSPIENADDSYRGFFGDVPTDTGDFTSGTSELNQDQTSPTQADDLPAPPASQTTSSGSTESETSVLPPPPPPPPPPGF